MTMVMFSLFTFLLSETLAVWVHSITTKCPIRYIPVFKPLLNSIHQVESAFEHFHRKFEMTMRY